MSQTELFAVDRHNEWSAAPIVKEGIRIDLPKEFLPCIDDWESLRVMADYVEDGENYSLAKLLRWTANEWEWHRGLMLRDCADGLPVWARFHHFGWSRAEIISIGPLGIEVHFYEWDRSDQHDFRAWWDLIPCLVGGQRQRKPKPRKGYKCSTNAKLAVALCGKALTHPEELA